MQLKGVLDRLYETCDFKERLKQDPIEFPRRYTDPLDVEIAGFIASAFAYGRIALFRPVISRILTSCGRSPHEFLINFDLRRDSAYFDGISYRFSTEKDVLCLIYVISTILRGWGSLKSLFYHYYSEGHRNIGYAIRGFMGSFLSIDTGIIYGGDIKPHGLRHFFPLAGSSACKRMNLFLRWMVRGRDIDFGIWNRVHPSKLIIPLDTHIAKIARCLGLTGRKTSDWKTATEITESLRLFDPEDPLKYDFVLCHYGISGECRGERVRRVCSACILYGITTNDHGYQKED